MFGSLILPLLISSLHLAVNNPFMILRSDGRNSTRMSRCLSVALCFLLSAANPIFLEAYYDEKKEEVRTLMQNYNTDAISALKTCKQIKRQSVEFLRIELGFYHFMLYLFAFACLPFPREVLILVIFSQFYLYFLRAGGVRAGVRADPPPPPVPKLHQDTNNWRL